MYMHWFCFAKNKLTNAVIPSVPMFCDVYKITIFTSLYKMNDVLNELANLSKLLQRSALLSVEAHQLCVSKVVKLAPNW